MSEWNLVVTTGVRAGRPSTFIVDIHDVDPNDLDPDEVFTICNHHDEELRFAKGSWQSWLLRSFNNHNGPSMSIGDFIVAVTGAPVRQMLVLTDTGWAPGKFTVIDRT